MGKTSFEYWKLREQNTGRELLAWLDITGLVVCIKGILGTVPIFSLRNPSQEPFKFMILQSDFFYKKLRFSYILQDFPFGIAIWIWAVENLRSSHYASVVCGLYHNF